MTDTGGGDVGCVGVSLYERGGGWKYGGGVVWENRWTSQVLLRRRLLKRQDLL